MYKMTKGTQVSYTYRRHYLLGGELVSGFGVILDEVVIGTDLGYSIKPNDGSDVVHVRTAGVTQV